MKWKNCYLTLILLKMPRCQGLKFIFFKKKNLSNWQLNATLREFERRLILTNRMFKQPMVPINSESFKNWNVSPLKFLALRFIFPCTHSQTYAIILCYGSFCVIILQWQNQIYNSSFTCSKNVQNGSPWQFKAKMLICM